MEQRRLGRTGIEVGIIGLGTEHLPRDRQVMDRVLGMAAEAGASYMDLLYVDAGYWEAFGDLYGARRDKIVAAAHWNSAECHDADESEKSFDNVLAHLGEHAEVGLITMVDTMEGWDGWAQRSLERLIRYREQGRIDAIGLSGHVPDVALKAVEGGQIDVLMFPVNLLGRNEPAEIALRRACAERGVGLVAMKAYHGGMLLRANDQPTGITTNQCLSYVFSLPMVSTAVPGPRSVEEWAATLGYLQSSDEERAYGPVSARLREILKGQCVLCFHCMPCPQEIEIPWVIQHVDWARKGVTEELRKGYAGFTVKASACTDCGLCEERCPYDVAIMDKMHRAMALYGS